MAQAGPAAFSSWQDVPALGIKAGRVLWREPQGQGKPPSDGLHLFPLPEASLFALSSEFLAKYSQKTQLGSVDVWGGEEVKTCPGRGLPKHLRPGGPRQAHHMLSRRLPPSAPATQHQLAGPSSAEPCSLLDTHPRQQLCFRERTRRGFQERSGRRVA